MPSQLCLFLILAQFTTPLFGLNLSPASLRPQGAGHHGLPAEVWATSAAEAAFEAAVAHCEARARTQALDASLSADVPRLLRRVFAADFERLLHSKKIVQNVTCMRPQVDGIGTGLFDDDLMRVPLTSGRVCANGNCCDTCSRLTFPQFATPAECEAFRQQLATLMAPVEQHPHHNLYLMACSAAGDVRTTLTFLRLVERMRRALAHEYGLPLPQLTPRQTFVSRITHACEERQSLHADEASVPSYHYSCVLYLSSQLEDFEGGCFTFSDPPSYLDLEGRGERQLRRLAPVSGLAVAFTSGWENMHFVEPISTGCRFAVPAFFTTASVGGESTAESLDDAAIAETLWQSALMPESEDDARQLLRQWHRLLAA